MKLLLAAVLLVSLAPQGGYRWVSYADGDQVQFGVPDSDDRGFWLSCEPDGRLEAGAAASDDPAKGSVTEVVLAGRSGSKTYRGAFVERGDGMNFAVEVTPQDPVIRSLLAGREIRVTNGGYTYAVPGRGAPAVLRPFLARCAKGAKSVTGPAAGP